ncbi:oligosaccharide flippase family protein [Bacteroidota bacterium]
MTHQIQKKVTRNTIFTGIGQVSIMFINFLLIPYIISKIGIERYGIWVLAFSVIGFIALLDFGIGDVYTKFVAEYIAKGSIEELNRIISTGFTFSIFIGLIFSFVLLLRNNILEIFNFQQIYMEEAYFIITWAIIIFIFMFISGIFNGLLWGMQRLGVLNSIDIISAAVNTIATIVFLELGFGIRGLIFSIAVYSLFSVAAKAYFSYRLLPDLSINPLKFKRDSLRIMLHYGTKLQITKIALFINMQIDKLFIGHFLNVAQVGYYDIGATLARTTRRIPMILLPALLPAASELDRLGDRETLYKLFIKSSKYVSLITIPLCFFIITNSTNLIKLWMGAGYEKSVMVLCFLSLGFAVNVLTGPGTAIVRGIGKPEIETRYTSVLAILNSVLSLVLIINFGLLGAVLGTSLSITICSIYFFFVLYKEVFQKPLWPFFKETFAIPIYTSMVFGVVIVAVNALLTNIIPLLGREYYATIILLNATIFFSGYIFLLFKKNFISYLEVKKLYGFIMEK